MSALDVATVRAVYATVSAYRQSPSPDRVAEFDAWLDVVRAKAWDEGNDAGEICAMDAESPDHVCQRNPYRRADR